MIEKIRQKTFFGFRMLHSQQIIDNDFKSSTKSKSADF
jgi:hypothetical protein